MDEGTKAAEKIPTFRNIHIRNLTATKSFTIANARDVQLKNVVVTVPNGQPFKLENAQVEGLN
jgi:hypothetical protein